MQRIYLTLIAGGLSTFQAHAQQAAAPPPYKSLRYDEDWSALRDPNLRQDVLDRLKYISLGNRGSFLSLGGEIRETWERYHNDFGLGPPDPDGYLLQRYLFHTDLHIGEHIRVFIQLQSGIENGRAGGPRPTIDEDKLDALQGFFELSTRGDGNSRTTLRVGRQEMQFGSGRLVARREGANTLLSFDGTRLILPIG